MENTIDPTGDANVLFTLRVLSGEMSGSELLLSAERYLIKTGKQSTGNIDASINQKDSADDTAISLFIPCGNTDESYYLDLRDAEAPASDKTQKIKNPPGSDYNIVGSSPSATEKPLFAKFNNVVQIGSLILAIKKESDQWDESVTNYIHIVHEDDDDVFVPADKRHKLKLQSEIKTKKVTFPVGIAVLLFIISIGVWFSSSKSEKAIKRSLADTVAGSINPVSIIKSKKNTYYLLAATPRDKDWILQALQKNPRPYNEKIEIILLEGEPEQLTNKFWSKGYQVLTVDLSAPLYPVVKILAEQKLTPEKLKLIKEQALEWMPFAEDLVINTYNKSTIINTAEDGLKLIYQPFAKLSTSQGATFSISGSLSDNDLVQLNQFIHLYQETWGTRYIKFDIKLENDFLKGKSYLNGQQGYVLMGKGHWYFPSI